MTTLAGLSRPMALLRLLAIDHPDLPAPHVHISPIYPNRLTLSIHDNLAAFEVWREALGIDPSTVTYRLQGGDTTTVLVAVGEAAGATVELVGYACNLALVTTAVA
ncbi:hypothetical protein [Streptomyces lasiicapitis]|uniref:hypothetical protein n=1 Tax=Streptomyces lasiicapitis TaxID=1923961 RepID=UPI0036A06DAF